MIWHARRRRWVGWALVGLALLLMVGCAGAPQSSNTVQVTLTGASGVSGTATLAEAGDGTNVTLDVQGLAPDADAQATMHGNTCEAPGASFAALPALKADASGKATATGAVLFRGAEPVALATMADGAHVITIQQGGQTVACGVIPGLGSR
jgi:hypothetical protein